MMIRRLFTRTLGTLAASLALLGTAQAQTPVEVPFYCPVAVGGPMRACV